MTTAVRRRVALVIALLSIPVQAFIVVTMWRWFVVPLGLPVLGTWHVVGLIGLLLIFRKWLGGPGPQYTTDPELSIGEVLSSIGADAVTLAIGALAHWLMTRTSGGN